MIQYMCQPMVSHWGWWCIRILLVGNPPRISVTWRSVQNHRPPTLTTNSRPDLQGSTGSSSLGSDDTGCWSAGATRDTHFVGDEVDEVCQVLKQYDYSLGCSNISQQCWLSPIWALVSGFGSHKVGHPHSKRFSQSPYKRVRPPKWTTCSYS